MDLTEDFVRDRITQLRLQKGVSEYKMSYDLGHSRGYVNNISSGKALPSMTEFFAICEYFGMSVIEFFDEGNKNPALMNDIVNSMNGLDASDLELIRSLVLRLKKT